MLTKIWVLHIKHETKMNGMKKHWEKVRNYDVRETKQESILRKIKKKQPSKS